jgi:ribosomal-protein-alanine N-acetyltransferase
MTADHLDQMEEIERICFPDPWSRRMLAEDLENALTVTLVAQGKDQLVLGYASLLVILDEGTVTNLAVRPEHRREGIATELLKVFHRFGEGTGLAFLTLEVRASNASAIALYEKQGYVQTGLRRNYYQHPREDAVIMTKEFTP